MHKDLAQSHDVVIPPARSRGRRITLWLAVIGNTLLGLLSPAGWAFGLMFLVSGLAEGNPEMAAYGAAMFGVSAVGALLVVGYWRVALGRARRRMRVKIWMASAGLNALCMLFWGITWATRAEAWQFPTFAVWTAFMTGLSVYELIRSDQP